MYSPAATAEPSFRPSIRHDGTLLRHLWYVGVKTDTFVSDCFHDFCEVVSAVSGSEYVLAPDFAFVGTKHERCVLRGGGQSLG